MQFGSLPAVTSRGDQERELWYQSEQKCKKCMNAKSPNTQQKISEHISSARLAGSPPAITCHMNCLNIFLCNSYAFCRIWCVVEGALNTALGAKVDHSTNLCELLKRCFINLKSNHIYPLDSWLSSLSEISGTWMSHEHNQKWDLILQICLNLWKGALSSNPLCAVVCAQAIIIFPISGTWLSWMSHDHN